MRRRIDLRLLDHVAHAEAPVPRHLAGHDAIAARLGGRHFHQGDDRPSRVLEDAAHLQETGGIGEDDIVRQHDREGLIADGVFCLQNGMTEAQGFFLADRDEVDHPADGVDFRQQVVLSAIPQRPLQFGVAVEVVEDRVFALGADDHQLVES